MRVPGMYEISRVQKGKEVESKPKPKKVPGRFRAALQNNFFKNLFKPKNTSNPKPNLTTYNGKCTSKGGCR
ncbi:MAG: hypothetical protein ACXABD_19080 [Candidatus Thorarchaeota archaeon]